MPRPHGGSIQRGSNKRFPTAHGCMLSRSMSSALSRHCRRHITYAGMGVPVLKMTALEGMSVPVLKTTALEGMNVPFSH